MIIRGVVSAHDNIKEGIAMSEKEVHESRWQDEFKKDIHLMDKDSEDNYTGWKVDVDWLEEQVKRYKEMEAAATTEEEKKEFSYFVFVVTKNKKNWGDHKNEKIVDPKKKCRLWIRGFRSYESFCEEFPPIQWP